MRSSDSYCRKIAVPFWAGGHKNQLEDCCSNQEKNDGALNEVVMVKMDIDREVELGVQRKRKQDDSWIFVQGQWVNYMFFTDLRNKGSNSLGEGYEFCFETVELRCLQDT